MKKKLSAQMAAIEFAPDGGEGQSSLARILGRGGQRASGTSDMTLPHHTMAVNT